MKTRSTTRFSLLVAIIMVAILLAGCQGSGATAVGADTAAAPAADTATPAPTRTRAVLPPTSTRTPYVEVIFPTSTPSPTPTITPNSPQTMAAKSTADKAVKCNKLEDAWLIKLTPSWKSGWCHVESIGGKYYEYTLDYPSQWTITTFGDVYPSVAFNTAQKGVELRIYQLYNYSIRKYEGTLEDAPLKAGFCDETDKCTLVVGAQEKITGNETRSIGGRETLVLDSQDGKYNVRRYFFFVPFKYARPASNRMFIVKLYTPEPVSGAKYLELENQIEDIIVSIKHDF